MLNCLKYYVPLLCAVWIEKALGCLISLRPLQFVTYYKQATWAPLFQAPATVRRSVVCLSVLVMPMHLWACSCLAGDFSIRCKCCIINLFLLTWLVSWDWWILSRCSLIQNAWKSPVPWLLEITGIRFFLKYSSCVCVCVCDVAFLNKFSVYIALFTFVNIVIDIFLFDYGTFTVQS